MVEIQASGPVEQRETVENGKQEDSDVRFHTVDLVDRREVSINVEYPEGYVNLEGYSPSHSGFPLEETSIERYVPDGWRIVDPDEWDVTIHGTSEEWVTAAERYTDERPDMDVEDALALFASWDEAALDGPDEVLPSP